MPINNSLFAGTEWWRGATIYQIYPRSFQDSNEDGIGDLKGITTRLEYVASLGVDGIWLSPFFTSPMKDFGYDVADYCGVDPIFGVLEDFDELVERAHELGLKVIIDQVYSHTSDQHNWFTESRANKTNPKADWYVWADPRPDGSPPNNWQAYFGGPSWHWDGYRKQYYLHNFLASQPDLNLHNDEVQNALLDVTRFWLDRGVDGFRLDVVNCFMHDPELRDNPPSNRPMDIITRSFDMQLQENSESHPGIVAFLNRLRGVLDSYEGHKFTVAEVAGQNPQSKQKAYTKGHEHLNTSYNFEYLYCDHLSGELIEHVSQGWTSEADEGWPSWAFSNHDVPRILSRWSDSDDPRHEAKLFLMLLHSLRGNIFLYQGEELGLPQAHVPFELLMDPEAIENWPHTLGRDGARTPMPWSPTEYQAGFTKGIPWLPLDIRHIELATDNQDQDESSVLNFSRQILSRRQYSPALRLGDISFLVADHDTLAFERTHEDENYLCIFNFSKHERLLPVDLPRTARQVLSTEPGFADQPPTILPAHSGYWLTF